MARPRQRILEYRSYELPVHFPITILHGSQWHISPIRSQRLHFHNCLEIGICLSNSGHMAIGEEQVDFRAGDVTFIARNVPHTTWSSPGTESLWNYIYTDPEALFQEAGPSAVNSVPFRAMINRGGLVLSAGEHPWAGPLVRDILREIQEQQAGYQICVKGLMAAFLVRVMRNCGAEQGSAEPADFSDRAQMLSISPALDYILQHYDQDFSMETLAAMCHLSPTHFRRQFQSQINMNPLAFLHQTRILRSCTLLRTTDRSIVDIAGEVGYTSLSCFNRWFLQVMGCTPSAWRKAGPGEEPTTLVSYTGWSRAETAEEILAREKENHPE